MYNGCDWVFQPFGLDRGEGTQRITVDRWWRAHDKKKAAACGVSIIRGGIGGEKQVNFWQRRLAKRYTMAITDYYWSTRPDALFT